MIMNYQDIINTILQEYPHVLLIGLRGGHALGIQSPDVDLLIVVEQYEDTHHQLDYQVVSWDKFVSLYINGALETVECLNNILYANDSIQDSIDLMTSPDIQELYYTIVESECYLVMKNQLKQIKRFPDKKVKFAAKSQLFYDILHDEHPAALLWDASSTLMDKHKKSYIKFREHPPNNIDEIVASLWAYRNDKDVKKQYIEAKNKAHNKIVKYFS